MSVLVPKAAAEQPRWQRALGVHQAHCHWLDPWQILRLPETPQRRQVWLNLDRYQLVICVSPTAAEMLVEALDRYWPMAPQVQWLCNGARTARVYEQYGLSAVYPESGFTAEDVLALPACKIAPEDEVLVVKGTEGRDAYLLAFTELGGKVTELPVYERRLNERVLDTMVASARQCDAIWLSSQFLGDALLARQPDFWLQWQGEWWVSSERLARWCQLKGLTKLRVASGATVTDLQPLIQEQYGHVE